MKSKHTLRFNLARGSVAIECAIILPIFLTLMTTMVLLGRIFWHYTVAEKAAHDAARFLATASPAEMRASSGGGEVPVVAVARRIVVEEVSELTPEGGIGTSVACYVGATDPYWDDCFGFETPRKVRVRVTIPMADPFFAPFTQYLTGGEPILLKAVMVSDFVGN